MEKRHFLRLPCILLLMAVMVCLASAGLAEDTRIFTDSVGRQVTLPASIRRIAPSGQLAQIVLYSLCPDRLIGWAAKPSEAMKPYLADGTADLPVFGQFYGKNMNLNMEALIAAKPDVIIDIGERKNTIREDMDEIAGQTGIPVVFVESTLDTMASAYKMLGQLTGMIKEAEELARYASETVEEARQLGASIAGDRQIRVYYAQGDDGLSTDPSGSIHADVIDLVGARNVADIALGSGSGLSFVSMEQVLLWQPDVILFAPGSMYEKAGEDPLWRQLRAVEGGWYYEIPNGPYNWLGRPPAINRLLGIKWLGNLLYPEVYPYDMVAEAQRFYKLFYHCDLSGQVAKALMDHSTYR